MAQRRYFASDNTSRVHDDIMNAVLAANRGYAPSYGDDPWTAQAVELFHEAFGAETDVFFVYNGTGANVLGISSAVRSWNAVVTPETSHIRMDECGAVEKFSGATLLTVPAKDGKLTAADIRKYADLSGNQHKSQPGIVSITQSTELGTVYTPEEIWDLASAAHGLNMHLHMDGARISNAAAALKTSLRELTIDVGVDILSFGGTKNGMMYGEAVLFFTQGISQDFPFIRKQGMQLASKMRYISAQFSALLGDELWRKNAETANNRAYYLAELLMEIPEIRITRKVQCNAVFAEIPARIVPLLLETNYFYLWDEERSEARLMTTFDTTTDDIEGFVSDIRQALERTR